MVVSPGGNWVAVGHASGVLTLLDLRMGTITASWKAHDGEVNFKKKRLHLLQKVFNLKM
jgi:hypothetical protein